MTITTVAHINLRGNAREALEFYQSVFGGDLIVATNTDAQNVEIPEEADQVSWGQVTSPSGFHIMAFDVPSSRPWSPGESPFFVSVRGTDETEISAYWERLSIGASTVVPLGPAGWSPLYGMLTDKFGVTWVLDIAVAYSA